MQMHHVLLLLTLADVRLRLLLQHVDGYYVLLLQLQLLLLLLLLLVIIKVVVSSSRSSSGLLLLLLLISELKLLLEQVLEHLVVLDLRGGGHVTAAIHCLLLRCIDHGCHQFVVGRCVEFVVFVVGQEHVYRGPRLLLLLLQ